jgi:hypothetical protein
MFDELTLCIKNMVTYRCWCIQAYTSFDENFLLESLTKMKET